MAKQSVFSAKEIRQHTEKGNLWLAIHGSVYDVSEFMEDHPYVAPSSNTNSQTLPRLMRGGAIL
jgi:hypothetical protein